MFELLAGESDDCGHGVIIHGFGAFDHRAVSEAQVGQSTRLLASRPDTSGLARAM